MGKDFTEPLHPLAGLLLVFDFLCEENREYSKADRKERTALQLASSEYTVSPIGTTTVKVELSSESYTEKQ